MNVFHFTLFFTLFTALAYASDNREPENSEQAESGSGKVGPIAYFTEPQLWVRAYGYDTMGWRVERHPRMLADVNGDGKADIVGFKNRGVYVSLSEGTKFSEPELWINKYAYNRGLWRVEKHPRMLADVNGDGKADIVGFGNAGVYVSLSEGIQFSPRKFWIQEYGYDNVQNWRVEEHPRMLADVDGDGKADVVGFGDAGAYVSLSKGTRFGESKLWIDAYGRIAGRWQVEKHPRMLADVNGDGKTDVVGFGNAGVYVSLSEGTQFSESKLWIDAYGRIAGRWQVEKHPRMLADVNGDGKADIVGFGNAGVYVALSKGTQFGESKLWIDRYGNEAGHWQAEKHPRMLVDVNGDGKQDIIGFYNDGVYLSLSDGRKFKQPQLGVKSYGYTAGSWRVEKHPRMLADVNGDGKQDIIGFYNDGVRVSLAREID